MGDLHLVMDDTPGVSAGDVEAKLDSGKPDVMFIDYLGLMRGDAAGNKPLWQITGEITHALKESARRARRGRGGAGAAGARGGPAEGAGFIGPEGRQRH